MGPGDTDLWKIIEAQNLVSDSFNIFRPEWPKNLAAK
jgi:hypothetical protein